MYKDLLEKISKCFDGDLYSGEIGEAKTEYFEKVGVVFEDDNIFEMRMAAFFDWFIYDRPVKNVGLPPIKIYFYTNENLMEGEDKTDCEGLLKTSLSLFLIKKKNKGGFEVLDLFDNQGYEVPLGSELDAIGIGNIVEARLIPLSAGCIFSDPIFPHPKEVSPKIKKEASKYKGTNRNKFHEFIFELATMNIKLYRYKHLVVKDIYKFK